MKPNPRLRFLSLLPILVLLGLTACATPASGNEATRVSAEQAPPPVIQPSAQVEPINDNACPQGESHPIAQSIAASYEVSYAQVMTWFCGGYSFDNILIALETSEAVDVPADTLLQMLLEKEWEEIWVEVGFTEGQ